MLKTGTTLIILLVLLSLFCCKVNKIIGKNFDHIIVFSDATAYFFKIKNDPFIQEDTLFINERDIEMIKDNLNNVDKILLTHKTTNEVLNKDKIREKIFLLSDIKFSLKKAIDFIFTNSLTPPLVSLVMRDSTLNKEDSEHLEKNAKEQNVNLITINNGNIQYLKNFITPEIKIVVLLSMKNSHIYLKRLSSSPFFKKIDFILIGDTRKNLKEINSRYVIGINELDLIDIVKKIDKNFHYELNIYKR
ncbi:hypothetical protein LKV13_00935 [Borrelia sp. BU AG58]|uniref:hypothetical protein n=1 Tax=Borrelia sp. BU AG58 TaxID=2887345 RepID=UPI001E5F36F4|nr:hypothetical protein [Borrelia sp. BU AG58]UER67387.1 hypothetical protein LKV13_00935 [Borrelia sp. BU AG58]